MAKHPSRPRRLEKSTGMIRTLVALKLREIEYQFDSWASFRKATGLGNATLYYMLHGQGNFEVSTLERLCERLGITVYELMNGPAVIRKDGTLAKNRAIDHAEIANALEKNNGKVDLNALQGGARKIYERGFPWS